MGLLTRPRWDVAERKAFELTKDISTPPVPVLEIAESNGVNVMFVDFGEHSQRVSGLCDFREARIYVNKLDGIGRQTFTMAHELGHWLLHRETFLSDPERYPVFPRFNKPDYSDPYEKEANKFAACLLVPQHLLKPVGGAPVSVLAKMFGVSRLMMENRLKNV